MPDGLRNNRVHLRFGGNVTDKRNRCTANLVGCVFGSVAVTVNQCDLCGISSQQLCRCHTDASCTRDQGAAPREIESHYLF